MKSVGVIFSFSLLLYASGSFASHWVQVASTADSVVEIDTETLKKDGNQRYFWERRRWTAPQMGADGKTYNNEIFKGAVDCVADTLVGSSITWRMGDLIVGDLERSKPMDIAPDSVSQGAERAVCR